MQVADTGTVNLPLLGKCTRRAKQRDSSSRTREKARRKVSAVTPGQRQIKEYNSQRVTVEGAVKQTRHSPLNGKTSLAAVGRHSGRPHGGLRYGDIVVFRQTDGKRYGGAIRASMRSAPGRQRTRPPEGDVVVVNSIGDKAALGDVLKALPVASFAHVVEGRAFARVCVMRKSESSRLMRTAPGQAVP